jgi:hypothetical protein
LKGKSITLAEVTVVMNGIENAVGGIAHDKKG